LVVTSFDQPARTKRAMAAIAFNSCRCRS
jgi:hypothetical protein